MQKSWIPPSLKETGHCLCFREGGIEDVVNLQMPCSVCSQTCHDAEIWGEGVRPFVGAGPGQGAAVAPEVGLAVPGVCGTGAEAAAR